MLSFLGLAWFWLVTVIAIVLSFRVLPDTSPCCYVFLLFDAGILISLSGMMLKLYLNIKHFGAKRNTSILDCACILIPLVLLILAYSFEGGEKGTKNGMLLALFYEEESYGFWFILPVTFRFVVLIRTVECCPPCLQVQKKKSNASGFFYLLTLTSFVMMEIF